VLLMCISWIYSYSYSILCSICFHVVLYKIKLKNMDGNASYNDAYNLFDIMPE
jgi:hypothetical protein